MNSTCRARAVGLAIGTALILLAVAAPALAASPPKGDYGCTFTSLSGTYYAGTLNIVGKASYTVNDKNKGKYRSKGSKLTFKTGSYKTLYFGKWSTLKTSYGKSDVVKLYGKKDSKEKLTCAHSR